jgi:predicted enzyme related to lactoylglutathione lyase
LTDARPASKGRAVANDIPADLTHSGGITYLHIPATDPPQAAEFYRAVFGWTINNPDSEQPSFTDGAGHVRGAFLTGQTIADQPGIQPFIYVDDIDAATQSVTEHGGQILTGPDPEGNLWIVTFRDPTGNTIGIWHSGPR